MFSTLFEKQAMEDWSKTAKLIVEKLAMDAKGIIKWIQ